jgi:hypothetical protein
VSTSQTQLQLRQRGLAIAGGGLVLQLIGLAIVVQAAGAAIGFISLVIAVIATVRTYVQVKDHVGTANTASVATVLIAFVSALVISSPLFGAVLVLIGAVVGYIGNKQLAAGVRS